MAAPDPGTRFDEAELLGDPTTVTPVMVHSEHQWERLIRRGYVVRVWCSICGKTPVQVLTERTVVTPERPRSGAVVLYLAVILVAIATGAIIALLWWGLR